jgi:hypothetical protein
MEIGVQSEQVLPSFAIHQADRWIRLVSEGEWKSRSPFRIGGLSCGVEGGSPKRLSRKGGFDQKAGSLRSLRLFYCSPALKQAWPGQQ